MILFFLISILSFLDNTYRNINNESFQKGEAYEYRVHLGPLTIGQAKVEVGKALATVNNRPCYQISIFGRTAGVSDLFKVRNNYRSFLDTAAIVPQKFYMNVSENKYKKEQSIVFDHLKNQAVLEEKELKKSFDLPNDIQDVVSIYYYFRTLNFSKMTVGEGFALKMFFDKELYHMKFKYMGREQIKTQFGKANVFKVIPVLPENKLFDGENAIRIWVSDDKNRIPLKVAADMNYVGDVLLDINSMRGNRLPIKWVK